MPKRTGLNQSEHSIWTANESVPLCLRSPLVQARTYSNPSKQGEDDGLNAVKTKWSYLANITRRR